MNTPRFRRRRTQGPLPQPDVGLSDGGSGSMCADQSGQVYGRSLVVGADQPTFNI